MIVIIGKTIEAVIVIEVKLAQRADGMSKQQTGTPGGIKLRALRERAGRTQLWVELEAALGTGYLQRIESGRVTQPTRATLERILAALETGYSEPIAVTGARGVKRLLRDCFIGGSLLRSCEVVLRSLC